MSWNEQAVEGWLVGYCYTINSIIGAGILAIPWAYYTSGWALGISCQLFIVFLSTASSYLYLSAWSRVNTLASLQSKDVAYNLITYRQIFQRPKDNLLEFNDEDSDIKEIKPIIGEKKYDLYEMLTMTMGRRVGNVVIISFILGVYPTLIAYLSVFSISLTSNVPIFGYTCNLYDETDFFGSCKMLYWGYLCFFSAFVICMSFFHMRELRWLQIPLTIFRFVIISLMIITCLYAFFTGTSLNDSKSPDPNPAVFEIKSISRIFFIIVFASLYENLIPTATGFVKDKSKNITKLINCAIATFNSLYIMLGLILCFSLESPKEMVSLNWRNYSAGNSQDDRQWWTYIIEYMIILLPAFDIASCFPIVANNFADNLICITYGHNNRDSLNIKIVLRYRMIVILPSIFVAVFIFHLGSILEFAGIFSLLLSGIFIPMAALAAQKLIREKSDYDFFDNFIVAVTLIVISTILLIFSLVSTISNLI